ncbi:MAG: hypothetical protein HQK83_01505 [Fibrobacteria bacterium]|nr:hypothetical protein [Fibrobacteria bacterium]
MPPDLLDFIRALNKARVRYLLVGGYSVILYGYMRSTMDMDIWVEKSKTNYIKLCKAFEFFQMPLFDMTEDNFLYNQEFDVYTFGRPPIQIDILNQVKGLSFKTAWENRATRKTDGVNLKLISKKDLIVAKKAAGRFKDLDDIEKLNS